MRLWSLDPKYLDRQGLLAVWREGLLARKVLENKTKGYKNYPQLARFKINPQPLKVINSYLFGIFQEALARNYKFKLNKVNPLKIVSKNIRVSNGQVIYEFQHLLNKLKIRDKNKYQQFKNIKKPQVHFLFKVVNGGIAKWEKIK